MTNDTEELAEQPATLYTNPGVLLLEVLFVGAMIWFAGVGAMLPAVAVVVVANCFWIGRTSTNKDEENARLISFGKERRSQLQGIGLWRKPRPRDFLVAAIGLVALLAVGSIYNTVLPDPSPVDTTTATRNAAVLGQEGLLAQVLILGGALLVAPALEELAWRGLVLDGLRRALDRYGLPTWLAIGLALVVSSAGFGFAHEQYNLHDQVLIAVSGLIYGLVFVNTRSVLLSALTHAAWNGWWVLSVALG